MPRRCFKLLAIVLALRVLLFSAMAHPTLAPIFTDHAVLQRDQPVPVWGRAAPGEKITVTFRAQTIGATADADGRWIVYLAPMSAAIEPAELVVAGESTVTIRDVLVGEVWLVSGQSNMEWPLSSTPDAAKTIAAINQPFIRQLLITHTVADAPADTVASSGWQAATPASASAFSAVAWYFAAELQRKLGVPVGIINSSWGGTAIEAWIDARTLRAATAWSGIEQRWRAGLAEFAERSTHHPAEMLAWQRAEDQARATKTKNPLPWPRVPIGPGTPYMPAGLFNAMIAPLQPYGLRGVLWYQGESDCGRPGEYAELFPAMIRAWRAQWGRELPFYFVQLPNYISPGDASGHEWAWLREAQTAALKLPATGMAVTIDCGDPDDIHPQNKPLVGRRLARLAESKLYGIASDWSGPRFASATREGSALRVRFTQVDTGLIAAGKPPQSFLLAGADRVFHPATAAIERDTVLVTAPQVPEPVAVRYAWSNAPVANLFNGAGLPAAPFRSDDW
ncbi:MAG: sialate O-acetylesterase [Opitutaceae bacterium]|nr:sialate O-acetylesterase [Opitutaceae bacterium]